MKKTNQQNFDAIIRNGTIYDGSGSTPYQSDIGVSDDKIVEIGNLKNESAQIEIDAQDLAVAPGFINMLSWANESLIEDGRSQSDIRQGVTLEIMGEGSSMGPFNKKMQELREEEQGDIKYKVEWTTLKEYLQWLEKKGVSPNIASTVGATTVRRYVLDQDDRAPNKEELAKMCSLVEQAMQDGAMGLSSALIYAPAFYAKTDELIALASAAAKYGGMYTSHLRSEGDNFLEALDEFLTIAKTSGCRSEVYHLKAAGKKNWSKMDKAIAQIEAAQSKGFPVTANMYLYTAAHTGLDAAMPPWVQEGGIKHWIERLKDPAIREKVESEMNSPGNDWENGYLHAGAEGVVLVGFKNPKLRHLTGKTLAQIAAERNKSAPQTAMDLVIEDGSEVSTVYSWMCEENIVKQIKLPWVSFGSDASSPAAEGVFLQSSTHPRTYGNFARLLGKYVRDQKVISLQEAVRKLTSLPAANLKLKQRGLLKNDYFADIVIFDPKQIKDNATFENPHAYASGMTHVLVNGKHVLKEGQHTGAKPGRVLYGPGYKP